MVLNDWYKLVANQHWLRIKNYSLERKIIECTSLDEFFAVLKEQPSDRFAFYEKLAQQKSGAIARIFDHLAIEPRGLAVLDIGPGYGEFLDWCKKMGSPSLCYIELDKVFDTFNRLKGYDGRRGNHLFAMKEFPSDTFDLVWASGPISADNLVSSKLGMSVLNRWLHQLDRIRRRSGHIIIKPAFKSKDGVRALGDATGNPFATIMFEHGYDCLPFFEHHNHEPEYPVTFCKKPR